MTPTVPIELDELDRRILEVLQTDAALPNNALAERVHASPPTCLRRVRRLVESGVIEKQVVIVSAAALGPTLTAIVEITLDQQGVEFQEDFELRVAADPAILQCYRVSPGPDFILLAQVRDMSAYYELAHRLFASATNVRNVRAFFSIKRSKFETRISV